MTVYSPATTAIGIIGSGSYLPSDIVPNSVVAERAGVTEEWIVRKTGILERRRAAPHEATSDLATAAARAAMDDAGISEHDIAWVIVATSTPDHPQPATACLVQDRIGATQAAAFDINAVCAGFVFALQTAAQLLAGVGEQTEAKYALVIGADLYSRILDHTDRKTAVLFGDGAGAVVLGPARPGFGIVGTGTSTDGSLHGLIGVQAGGSRYPASTGTLADGQHFFRMRGREVRDFVNERLPLAVQGVLDAHDIDPADVKHFIPHQANGVMVGEVIPRLGLPNAHAYLPVDRHANTGAASIPLALDQAHRSGALADGELVLLAGFGGGMAVGTAVLRWDAETPKHLPRLHAPELAGSVA
ncbi:beta-ketoacyl-ACP synthase 3 [Streptomyces sp. H27-C3]|uniref:3-oxoacyl-ACP synthase III family protein n=1 Tax=Streptomyces sp. H27-C3 TaxID=3046305 RepID=UPI0024BA740D|nr:beta-ketoacyl-ACP synthase 3 [Streptomyces sp. H27-C3]MDJ0465889.1 beta-ketoacyl-ACP synthase 3 [Streptomyces sp. H27-C3]